MEAIISFVSALCPEQASKLNLTSARLNMTHLDKNLRSHSETQLNFHQLPKASTRKESASLNDITLETSTCDQTKTDLLSRKSEIKKELRFDDVIHDIQSDALRICNQKIREDPNCNSETWKILEEEISDVKLLIESYHETRQKTITVKRTKISQSNMSSHNLEENNSFQVRTKNF